MKVKRMGVGSKKSDGRVKHMDGIGCRFTDNERINDVIAIMGDRIMAGNYEVTANPDATRKADGWDECGEDMIRALYITSADGLPIVLLARMRMFTSFVGCWAKATGNLDAPFVRKVLDDIGGNPLCIFSDYQFCAGAGITLDDVERAKLTITL
jgi:hypothetical protein